VSKNFQLLFFLKILTFKIILGSLLSNLIDLLQFKIDSAEKIPYMRVYENYPY
jgi:hypothetical protein